MAKHFQTKKGLAIALALVLLINLMGIAIQNVFATGIIVEPDPTITVGSVSGVQGETVDVPVSIANNSGIVSLNVNISYDSTKLKLTGVTNGTVLSDPAHSGSLSTNPYRLCFAMDLSPVNVTANGVIATLSFEILATAAPGDTPITVNYNPNEIYDINYKNIFFEKINGKVTVMEAIPVVTSIAMESLPTKTTYFVGQDLDLTGAKIKVTYDNATTDDVIVTSAMVSGYDKTTAGNQTVTVTYEGKTTTFNVTVNNKSLTGITVTTPPTKTSYIEGNTFDKTGMVITANFDDGSNEIVTIYAVSPETLTLGTTVVTITYSGKTATTPVTVAAKTLQSIAVTTNPAITTYKIGTTFSAAGGKITLTYDNGTTSVVDITDAMCSGYNMNSVGAQTVTVTYQSKTATFGITVQNKELVSISIKTQPSIKTFIEGNAFAVDGVITLHYDNDTTEDKNITAGMCSGYNMNQVGVQTVTITESGKTTTYQITVNAKSLQSISIKTQPTQKTFIEGNTFAVDGVITLHYDNGTTADKNITAVMCSGYNMNQVGIQTVTITESGKTATYQITVNAKSLQSISIKTQPSQKTFIEGNTFTVDGVITLHYDNGTTADKNITAGMCSGYNMNQVGIQTVTITEGGRTTTYQITVNAKTLLSIAVTTNPTKTAYQVGEAFSAAGGKITLTYDNGSTGLVDMTNAMCSGYNMNNTGNQTVTVTFQGKTATYTINVTTAIPSPVITVGTVSGKQGETVNVPVSIANNSGIVSLNVSIAYDSTKLRLTGVTNGTVLTDPAHSGSLNTNPYKLSFAMDLSPVNITANGVIATLQFEILSDAVLGDTSITVNYNPNEIYDISYTNVFFEKVNGKITISEADAAPFYKSFLDEEVKIWAEAGVLPKDANFTIIKIMPPPQAVVDKVNDQISPNAVIIAYYEITLEDAQGKYITKLTGEITIATKLPAGYENGEGVSVYMENDKGILVKMETWVLNGYIYFKTDWLETYDY